MQIPNAKRWERHGLRPELLRAIGPGLVGGLVMVLMWCSSLHASDRTRSISDDSAAFVYGLAKFVTWPESAFDGTDNRFVVVAVGGETVREGLISIQGKQVHSREVVVKGTTPSGGLPPCQLVVVGHDPREGRESILEAVRAQPVLTVSHVAGFARGGGMVSFSSVGRDVDFEINLGAVNEGGLKVSSQLLRQARVVWTGVGCGDD